MENLKFTMATLDNKIDLSVELANEGLSFEVHRRGAKQARNEVEKFASAYDAIVALQRRGYQYAEDLVRVVASAVWTASYAA